MPPLGNPIRVRRKRRVTNRHFRLTKAVWQDPYPAIPGTEPEKRVFEILVRRRIYFIFQGDLKEFSDTKKLPTLYTPGFKPDFILPEWKVIIDPFGIFHHSLKAATGDPTASTLEGRIGTDAIKAVVYRALGYKFYHPWWDEKGWLWQDGTSVGAPNYFDRLGYDTNALIDRMTELHLAPTHKLKHKEDIQAKIFPGYRLGPNLGAGANSVAIANHMRAKPVQLRYKRRVRRSR